MRPDHAKTESSGGSMRPHSVSSTIDSDRSARRRPKKRVAPITRVRSDSSPTAS